MNSTGQDRPNLIVIVADTLRADYLGCYGNADIRTRHIDALAKDAVTFTQAYPEALPTIVYRRALHTGRRAYPFHNYRPLKWDIVSLPGWQPMANEEDTLAENLAGAGYYTGFVTDTLPYFAPGMNFTRGFQQWEYIRGKQQDRWRSPATVTRDQLHPYGDPDLFLKDPLKSLPLRHVANIAHQRSVDDTTTLQVFRWATDFLHDNQAAQPFYLLVDSFAPHEPWEAPPSYLRLYVDPSYQGRTIVHVRYGPMDDQLTAPELEHVKAHYSGLVTLVDTGVGRLLDTLKLLDLYDNSVIVLTSDHGTSFADNPERVVGKPHYALYPGVMHVPLIVRFPGGRGSGTRCASLVSNVDIVAPLYQQSGVGGSLGAQLQIDGRDLSPLASGNAGRDRAYLTCRYGNSVWYRDQRHWVVLSIDGVPRAVFDLQEDPHCRENIVASASIGEVVQVAWRHILDDTGGSLPDYRKLPTTDAIGQASGAGRTP